MAMTSFKKKGALLLLVVMTITAVWIPAYASDDNIPYDFNLKSDKTPAYTAGRYRQTTNVYNHWKVDMRYHSRGDNAQATYYLAKVSGKARVSDKITTTPKVGAVKRSAYKAANQSNVCLAAHVFTAVSATVGGYWDEETK